jgi:hypothetical protein
MLSDMKERPFTANIDCPVWQLLTVDREDSRECVADCKEEDVEERLLLLEKDLCLNEVSFRF